MCLDTLASARELKRVRRLGPIIAWKVVRYKDGAACFQSKYQSHQYAPAFVAQQDKSKVKLNTESWPARRYPTGFHAWATKAGACDLFPPDVPNLWNRTGQIIVPVLLQNIVAVGKQEGQVAYVARKMTILAEVPAAILPEPEEKPAQTT